MYVYLRIDHKDLYIFVISRSRMSHNKMDPLLIHSAILFILTLRESHHSDLIIRKILLFESV